MQVLSIHRGQVAPLDALPEHLETGQLLWVDCHYDEARDWVEPVHRLTGAMVFEDHLIDAENAGHPSYFDATTRYELIVFRGLSLPAPASEDQELTRVRTRPTVFFLFPSCLVTVRAPDSRTAPAMRERLRKAAEARQRLPDSPEALMLRMLNHMVDRFLELRQPLTAQLDRWQRRLLDHRRPFRDWPALLEARGELRRLEQLCEEQLDAIQGWHDDRQERVPADDAPESPGLAPLDDALEVRTNDLVKHIQRVLAHARRLEQSLDSALQLHFSSTAHRTNEIMRMLTTITAIFMPLTLITGIFGMNFEFMPGLHTEGGFWLTIGAMGLIAALSYAWFRARRLLEAPRGLSAASVSGRGSRRSPSPNTPARRRRGAMPGSPARHTDEGPSAGPAGPAGDPPRS